MRRESDAESSDGSDVTISDVFPVVSSTPPPSVKPRGEEKAMASTPPTSALVSKLFPQLKPKAKESSDQTATVGRTFLLVGSSIGSSILNSFFHLSCPFCIYPVLPFVLPSSLPSTTRTCSPYSHPHLSSPYRYFFFTVYLPFILTTFLISVFLSRFYESALLRAVFLSFFFPSNFSIQ